MSKRNLVLVMLALLLALTPVLGLAESHTTSGADQGQTLAMHLRFGDPLTPLRDPTCPDPSHPGCGGG